MKTIDLVLLVQCVLELPQYLMAEILFLFQWELLKMFSSLTLTVVMFQRIGTQCQPSILILYLLTIRDQEPATKPKTKDKPNPFISQLIISTLQVITDYNLVVKRRRKRRRRSVAPLLKQASITKMINYLKETVMKKKRVNNYLAKHMGQEVSGCQIKLLQGNCRQRRNKSSKRNMTKSIDWVFF